MKVVYASRTGNVEALIGKLGITDALHIEDGTEKVSEDYILFTYTDGFGDVPYEVSDFLENNPSIKGVIASGDTGYHVPCLYKVENDGTDEDVEAIKELL